VSKCFKSKSSLISSKVYDSIEKSQEFIGTLPARYENIGTITITIVMKIVQCMYLEYCVIREEKIEEKYVVTKYSKCLISYTSI